MTDDARPAREHTQSSRPPRLVLLTDGVGLTAEALLERLAAFVAVGLTGILVRERHRPQPEREALADTLSHDDVWVTLASPSERHPVHLRADETPSRATAWGRSCHTPEQVTRAQRDGAQWVTLSPYAPSISKPGHGAHRVVDPPPVEARASPDLAVYALGGVTPANAGEALAWAGHGIAVHGAVWKADEPARQITRFLTAVTEFTHQPIEGAPS